MEVRRIQKGIEDDLVLLNTISEDAIVQTLKNRFSKDLIYTYIGPVLISVNPFKDIGGLYSRQLMSRYTGRYLYESSPHAFAIADETYRNCMNDGNQCILISGESGAGKTEAAKKVMEYISAVSGDLHNKHDVGKIKNALLASNPLLEAFGNAKTLRNDNSSRFGKYMEIQMNYGGVPIGGKISNYLLEKPRVVGQANGERNFHIFYQLCTSGERSLGMDSPNNFEFLAKSGCVSVKSINDSRDFKTVLKSLDDCGVDQMQTNELFRVVAAVAHLGNVTFSRSGQLVRASSKCRASLSKCAELLQVSSSKLEKALTYRTYTTRKDRVKSPLQTTDECIKTRDALAKALYSRVFEKVVGWANRAIQTKEAELTIGVLDIYGFEIFEHNSFEQLCINYCNEKLQQLFIELTLQSEQEEYAREGIQWTHIDYFNNKIVCDLIEAKRPAGVFAFLDEESIYPKGSDGTLLKKLNSNLSRHQHYESLVTKMTHDASEFKIKHYAGEVIYSVDGMLDKNKDTLFRDLIELGGSSRSHLVSSLFPEASRRHNMKKPISAASQFRTQMIDLIKTLEQCEPHYIRCIKPNDNKRSGLFDLDRVVHQVKYLGLQENVRVRRAGFAYRRTYREFAHRYKMICPEIWPFDSGDPNRDTETILRFIGVQQDQYQFGKTKVFIRKPETLFALEDARDKKLPQIVTMMQRVYREYKTRKFYLDLREKSMTVFAGKKRRRGSWVLHCGGDYIYAKQNPKIQSGLAKYGDNPHNILFANNVEKVSRKGKIQRRVFVITKSNIYLFSNGKVSRALPKQTISGVRLSTYADGYIAINFNVPEADMFLSSMYKGEIVACLSEIVGANNLQLEYSDQFTILAKKGKKTTPKQVQVMENNAIGNMAISQFDGKGPTMTIYVGPRLGSQAEYQINTTMPWRMEKALQRVQMRENQQSKQKW